MGYNTTFNTTPQPQKTLGGLLSPLSNMNQQIKSSPILNPTGQSSQPIPVPASASKPMNPAISSVVPGILNPHPTAPNINPVASHTTTTNPDGTTTTKQTYDTTTGFLTPEGIAEGKPVAQPNDPAAQKTTSQNQSGNVGNTTGTQISNVGSAGGQTANEATTFGGLLNQSQNPSPAYTEAMGNYNTANQKLADYNAQLAQTDKNINAQGISLDSARGQMANVGQAATAEEAALQGGVTNASNILSAANQQQGLQVQAGTAANSAAQTQANRNLAGQEAVLGAVQPQPYGITSTPYNPATGTYGGMAGTSGAGGNGSLASVGGLLQTQNMGGQVKTMQGIQAQAQTLGTNLSNLISQAGINPANMSVTTSFINGVNQWLNGQAGDPKYQNFANLISEVASKYSNILNQSGGTPTDVSTTTHNIINGLASGQSIQQVLQSLDKNATDSITALDKASKNQPSGGLNTNQTNNTNYNW